jgi:molybdopterin molybdotransferase
MQERVAREAGAIVLRDRPRTGLNIRRRGEDAAEGVVLVVEGAEVGPRESAAIASVGCASVPVRRRLRVALLCSGNELRAPGEALFPGTIYDANRFGLGAALSAPWTDHVETCAVADEPLALAEALRSLAARSDLIVSTGGASVGDEDHMACAAAAAGGWAVQLRVAMKPGKPMLIGRIGDAVYLGLPGNPVAALVGWALFGEPMARRAAGFTQRVRPVATVTLSAPISRAPGRREFRPARLLGAAEPGRALAEPLHPQFAARIGGLAACDGLIVIPEHVAELNAGAIVEFHSL